MEGVWEGAELTLWQTHDNHSVRVIPRIRYFSAQIDASTYPPKSLQLARGPPRPPPSHLRSQILLATRPNVLVRPLLPFPAGRVTHAKLACGGDHHFARAIYNGL